MFLINKSMAYDNTLNRQPTKLDYSAPTQFRFTVTQLPKVEYFTVSANIPGINLGETTVASRFKDIPMLGDVLAYEDLNITFIVDEFLENYIQLHEWLTGIGFPKNTKQFRDFRQTTSNSPITTAGTRTLPDSASAGSDIADPKLSTPERGMFGDATMTLLTNKNNPAVEVRFQDLFPVSLGALNYTQNATDIEYITVDATFKYKLYEIHTL